MGVAVSKGLAVTHSAEVCCKPCKADYANRRDVPRRAVPEACCKYTFIAG